MVEKTLTKTQRKQKTVPGIPEIATIEHTWIQRDSNFASLRGLDSHLSL